VVSKETPIWFVKKHLETSQVRVTEMLRADLQKFG